MRELNELLRMSVVVAALILLGAAADVKAQPITCPCASSPEVLDGYFEDFLAAIDSEGLRSQLDASCFNGDTIISLPPDTPGSGDRADLRFVQFSPGTPGRCDVLYDIRLTSIPSIAFDGASVLSLTLDEAAACVSLINSWTLERLGRACELPEEPEEVPSLSGSGLLLLAVLILLTGPLTFLLGRRAWVRNSS